MPSTIDIDAILGNFAVLAYENETYLRNPANLPEGWIFLDSSIQGPFAGFAFQNITIDQIVISYRGTDSFISDG